MRKHEYRYPPGVKVNMAYWSNVDVVAFLPGSLALSRDVEEGLRATRAAVTNSKHIIAYVAADVQL